MLLRSGISASSDRKSVLDSIIEARSNFSAQKVNEESKLSNIENLDSQLNSDNFSNPKIIFNDSLIKDSANKFCNSTHKNNTALKGFNASAKKHTRNQTAKKDSKSAE